MSSAYFNRKLEALDFPHRQSWKLQDTAEFRRLIIWLEDTKIRALPIEAREPLRKTDENNWNKTFCEYLATLKCPRKFSEKMSDAELALVLDWVLGFALALDYRDTLQSNQDTATMLKEQTLEDNKVEDQTDYNSPEFKAAVYNLASTLKIPTEENIDIKVILKSILEIIEKKFTADKLEQLKAKSTSNDNNNNNNNANTKSDLKIDSAAINEEKFPLGFDTGDSNLNKAATVLRMLYIDDLRQLQTKINEMIVSVQNYTANPKTDTSLGKVGK